MPRPPSSALRPSSDTRLGYEFRRVERRVRSASLHRHCALVWGAMLILAAIMWGMPYVAPSSRGLALPVLVPCFIVGALLAAWLAWRDRADLQATIRAIEQQYPELGTSLRTAIEQQPDEATGRFHFLQRRVIQDVVGHSAERDWAAKPRRTARRWATAHFLGLAGTVLVSVQVVQQHPFGDRHREQRWEGFEVLPGDTAVERGSTVIVTMRFGGTSPSGATLHWQPTGDAPAQRLPMHQALSDPVVAASLVNLSLSGTYWIEHDGTRTPAYRVEVFERPALVRADATLDYPEYTGLVARTLPDVRRLSAVVGTRAEVTFLMNQPLRRAVLRSTEHGTEIELQPQPGAALQYRWQLTLEQSDRYTLHLVDEAGRTNAIPTEFRIDARENRRPELRLTSPSGDQRLSPLEEVQLMAEARDDFGLRDYGVAYSVGHEPPRYVSLAGEPTEPPLHATMEHLVSLEMLALRPRQLVTWFAWADDHGPDGALRRTTGDLAFAEIRPLDEIFRESETGGSPAQAGEGGDSAFDLLEVQRQISVAIWKLHSRDDEVSALREDITTTREGQQQAQRQLQEVSRQLNAPGVARWVEEAGAQMEATTDHLTTAADRERRGALQDAWLSSQAAYQALLRLQPDNTDVARSSSAGGRSGRRNQRQLNELEFRRDEDRYATESQAQAEPTPEEREQLQVLARLRELARRQQDLNERLQELQTALNAAKDQEEQEELRRELKRLEQEQRRMLADLDEVRDRAEQLAPGERAQDARNQLQQTRESMQRAGEQLGQGEVSQALAAGTRAREGLEQTGEGLRQDAASRFGEQMRQARQEARELATTQADAQRQLEELAQRPSLDDTSAREALARQLEAQAERRRALLNTLRQVTEDAEASEPQLHRQLYDLLRQQDRSGTEQQLTSGAELLRRGFIEPVMEPQAAAARTLADLQSAVERAADSVLGDELNELRFVQRELEQLTNELQRERAQASADETAGASADGAGESEQGAPGNESKAAASPGETSSKAGRTAATSGGIEGNSVNEPTDAMEELRRFAEASGPNGGRNANAGPLTGPGFGAWADRLRTVEQLLEDPQQRQRLAQARFEAEELRRGHQREGVPPQWDLVDLGIVGPLQETRAWIRQELNRREQPDALQPIDRDPVPDRFAESVRKYYEALGSD